MNTSNHRKQEVIALLDEFDRSNKTMMQFCKERNFPYHIFKYWHHKLRPTKASATRKRKFIPLNFPNIAPNSVIAEIRYPSGTSIFIYTIDDVEKLKFLV